MILQKKIRICGNSIGLLLHRTEREMLKLKEGDVVEIKVCKIKKLPQVSEDDLLKVIKEGINVSA
jgi:antitoxin component of MazEF toxin-antitoxin module